MLGVICELDNGCFGLTPIGELLRTSAPDSLRPLARLNGHPAIQLAWANLLGTTRTGATAFDLGNGTDFGAYLNRDADLAARFHPMMAGVTAAAASAVVTAYDFSRASTLVDVGGGEGGLMRAILRANPDACGTVADLAHVQSAANAAIVADGLADRCRFVECDFFVDVPAGADLYLLKSVIHDWDDEHCVAILRTCRRAVAPRSRLLLIETVLPGGGQPSPSAVMGDLIMLAMSTGRERTETEHARVLGQAGFRLERTLATASGSSILEAAVA
jgi:hypothetical protein